MSQRKEKIVGFGPLAHLRMSVFFSLVLYEYDYPNTSYSHGTFMLIAMRKVPASFAPILATELLLSASKQPGSGITYTTERLALTFRTSLYGTRKLYQWTHLAFL